MDGILVDSEPLWLEAELEMLRRYDLEFTTELRDELIGSGLWTAAERFREVGVPLTADEIVDEWIDGVIARLRERGPEWRPGARELVASLREAGIPSVLVTMSVRRFAECVVSLLPEGSFDLIVPGDEVEHEKPHPDPYLRAAEKLGVPIERCIAFEDSRTGLRAASASGAVAIGIPNLLELDGIPAHEVWRTLEGVDAAGLRHHFERLREAGLTVQEPAEQDRAEQTERVA